MGGVNRAFGTGFGRVSTRPAPMGAYEARFVREKRAVRASWDDVAKMLGRSVEDVRRKFDPDFVEPAPRIERQDLGLTRQQSVALCALLSTEGTLKREELGKLLFRGSDAPKAMSINAVVSQLRTKLEPWSIAIPMVFREGWRLTPADRETLAALGWGSVLG